MINFNSVGPKYILQSGAMQDFEKILNDLTPRYGKPQINLEGSGEPTYYGKRFA